MTREDAKDLALSILVVVTALLVSDNIWLHCKCASQRDEIAELGRTLALHVNPPPGPSLKERTKAVYDKTKEAVKRGYDKVKEGFTKKPEDAAET